LFPLPTVESLVRVFVTGSFMGDVGVREIFLNFILTC